MSDKVLITTAFPTPEDVARRLGIKPARAAELRSLVLELHGDAPKTKRRKSAPTRRAKKK